MWGDDKETRAAAVSLVEEDRNVREAERVDAVAWGVVGGRGLEARFVFFFQAEDGIRDYKVTGVQTCALPICACAGGGHRKRLQARVICRLAHVAVGITSACRISVPVVCGARFRACATVQPPKDRKSVV